MSFNFNSCINCVSDDEYVMDLKWHSYGDGQHVLSIGTNKRVQEWTQRSVSTQFGKKKKPYWNRIANLKR